MELEQELEEGEQEEKRGREEEERKGRQKKGLPRGLGAYTAAAFLKEALDSDDDDDDDDEGMETFDGEEVKWGALEVALRREARDYSARFLGACNTTTDIKEVLLSCSLPLALLPSCSPGLLLSCSPGLLVSLSPYLLPSRSLVLLLSYISDSLAVLHP